MSARENPISLNPEEDGILRKLYVRFRIPRDQYKRRPKDLAALIRQWNKLSDRNDVAGQVIRYITNKQKAKRRLPVPWPTFDGNHQKAETCSSYLDDKQLAILREIYEVLIVPLGLGVDGVTANGQLCDELSKQFGKRAGIVVPGLTLVSIAEDERKRGRWCKVGRRQAGWADLDVVAQLKVAAGTDADSKTKKRKPK